jgi:hypothetical protein
MSTYRPIERLRHSDERIMDVGPIARAVWDYLCCNKQDHTSGLYSLSVAAACEDTGWTTEQFEGALGELEGVGLIELDRRRRLVWVRNMLRKAYPGGKMAPNQKIGVEKHLNSMPRSALVARLVAYYAARYGMELAVDHDDEPMGNPSATHASGDGNPCPRVPSGSCSVRVGSDRVGSEPERPRGLRTVEDLTNDDAKTRLLAQGLLTDWSQSRPPGCRAWGQMREQEACAALLTSYGRETLDAVVAFVRREIEAKRLEVSDWSKLWARKGEIFGIRLAELEADRAGIRTRASPRGPVDPSTQDHSAPKVF